MRWREIEKNRRRERQREREREKKKKKKKNCSKGQRDRSHLWEKNRIMVIDTSSGKKKKE